MKISTYPKPLRPDCTWVETFLLEATTFSYFYLQLSLISRAFCPIWQALVDDELL